MLARNIAGYLFSKLPRRSTIIILEGTPASATSRERLLGFQDALAAYPAINARSSLRGDYQRDVARDVFLRAKDQWPGVDVVVLAQNSEMTRKPRDIRTAVILSWA